MCLQATASVGGSSRVWLCATSHAEGQPNTVVYVLDAHNPGSPLEMFSMPSTHILCIASVPGMFHWYSCIYVGTQLKYKFVVLLGMVIVIANFAVNLNSSLSMVIPNGSR